MFCKNCGEYVEDNQSLCKKCGIAVGEGMNFCSNCGSPMNKQTFICDTCGMRDDKVILAKAKSMNIAVLLALFLGQFGVHNFYLGYKKKAIAQLAMGILSILLMIVPDASAFAAVISAVLLVWVITDIVFLLLRKTNKDASGMKLK